MSSGYYLKLIKAINLIYCDPVSCTIITKIYGKSIMCPVPFQVVYLFELSKVLWYVLKLVPFKGWNNPG